jgi:hypothetical protein
MNKMIEITNTEILVNEDNNTKDFKIHYKYLGEENMKLKISVVDNLFKLLETFMVVSVSKNGSYWCILTPSNIDEYSNTYFTMGVDIIILNNETLEIIHEESIPFIITDLKKRSLNSKYSHSIQNFWVIGDSHVGRNFSKIKNLCYNDKYIINYISHMTLAISRFVKSDWNNFLKTIPIKDGDILTFLLGDIDLRANIIWKTNHIHDNDLRINNLTREINKLSINYLNTIKEIKKIYSKCEVIILTPNSPVRDTFEDKSVIAGTEEERMFLWKSFNSFFSEQKDIEYWNLILNYIDNEGFMRSDLLLNSKDIHVADGTIFIKELINNINMKLV